MDVPKVVELTYKGDVRVMKVDPGDCIIVCFAGRVEAPAIMDVRERLQKIWPMNEVLILAGLAGELLVRRAGSDNVVPL